MSFTKKITIHVLLLLTMIALTSLTSCVSHTKMVDRFGISCNPLPQWVNQLPSSSNKIYAVGFAMPDTFPERSLSAAKLKARVELARTIETQIEVDSQMVDSYMKQSGVKTSEKSRTTVIRNIIKEKATKMVKNSKVEKIFYDNCNFNKRGEAAHYVLASTPR